VGSILQYEDINVLYFLKICWQSFLQSLYQFESNPVKLMRMRTCIQFCTLIVFIGIRFLHHFMLNSYEITNSVVSVLVNQGWSGWERVGTALPHLFHVLL